jgi:NitT/TauT family transport system ATP-binding protein
MDNKVESSTTPAPGFTLKVENVSKSYATTSQEVSALQPINLEIQEGEFAVFVGPSGCGKSTLLNIIAGFEEPSSGQITLDGKPVTKPGRDRLMMFQEHALFPWLRVIDNVMFGLKRNWLKPRLRKERAQQFLKLVHLEGFEKSNVHELSGGMKQRVALARALAPDPKILLIDEPFPALDAMTRLKLYAEIQEIYTATHKTIIFVTHDMQEAACLGDRIFVFSGRPGQINKEVRVDLPRPREFNDPKVNEVAASLMDHLKEQDAADTESNEKAARQ